ncbi:uncharacterized protein LOC129607698 isoform X2 [Condylostylus longicornis]|uniref:uncharacterized protein LOC129607698 isoform X2 n=1 Tax=Condylostylus longicornis TaxID=2530218 RepID=UPI00244E324E|nr:uncharacterized protein LOC129607698 isoform X2 [Condylostylus longicornis]
MLHRIIVISLFSIFIFDSSLTDLGNENSHGCLVPSGNIILTEFNTNKRLMPGTLAPIRASVIYACQKSYVLEGKLLLSTLNFCEKGNWTFEHPECIKLCPSIRGHTIEANCEYNGQSVDCKGNVKYGTTARINCAILYKRPKTE